MAPIPQNPMDRELLESYGLGGRASSLVIVSFVMLFLAIAVVINRFVCRIALKKPLGMDDYVIVLSLASCTAMIGVILIGVNYGYGRRLETISTINLYTSLKMFWILQILYKCTINTMKLSVLLLYRKIFKTNRFKFQKVCGVLFVVIVLHTVATTIATILECLPMSKVWDRNAEGTCINLTLFWHINAIFNIVMDFTIFFLPMPVINTLRLPLQSKIGLMGVFALGAFVCTTTIIRLTTLSAASKTDDQNFGTMTSTTWTIVEASTGIICSCLPMLRVPLTRIFPNCLSINWHNGNAKYMRSFPLIGVDTNDRKRTHGETERSSGRRSSSTSSPGQRDMGLLHPVEIVDANERNNQSASGSGNENGELPRSSGCTEASGEKQGEGSHNCSTLPNPLVVPELAHLAVKSEKVDSSQTSCLIENNGGLQLSRSASPDLLRRPHPAMLPRNTTSPLSLRENTRVGSPSSLSDLARMRIQPDRTGRLAYMAPASPSPTTLPPASPPALKESPTIPEEVALPPSRKATPAPKPAATPSPAIPPRARFRPPRALSTTIRALDQFILAGYDEHREEVNQQARQVAKCHFRPWTLHSQDGYARNINENLQQHCAEPGH